MRLIASSDILAVCRYGEANPQCGQPAQFTQRGDVAKDERATGLDDEYAWWMAQHGFQNLRHEPPACFGGLIRVDQRRTVNHLIGFQRGMKKLGRIALERGELTPARPITGCQTGIETHGRYVAVRASVRAVSRRRQRVCKTRFREKAADERKDASRCLLAENGKNRWTRCHASKGVQPLSIVAPAVREATIVAQALSPMSLSFGGADAPSARGSQPRSSDLAE